MVPPIENCTVVHQGTYDAEFMTMCSAPIEVPGTTTQTPTEPAQTSSAAPSTAAQTDTEQSPSPQHVETTTQIPVEGTTSTNPLNESDRSYTIETTPSPVQVAPTTRSPVSSPSPAASVVPVTDEPFIPRNTSKQTTVTETKIIERSENALATVALIVSIVSIFGCIAGVLYMRHRHAGMVRRKSVSPTEVQLQQLQQGGDTPDKTISENKSMEENKIKMTNVHKAMQSKRVAAMQGKRVAASRTPVGKRAALTPPVKPMVSPEKPPATLPPKKASAELPQTNRGAPPPAVNRTAKHSVRNVSNVARMIHKFDTSSAK